MFFKDSDFKRLLKEAYKYGGLHIGNTGKTVYIASEWWVMEVQQGEIPKEKLAGIIELVGELPEPGAGIHATKDFEQYEFVENDRYAAIENAKGCLYKLKATGVSVDGFRILQHDYTRTIILVRDDIVAMIRPQDVEDGHTQPEGPVAGRLPGVFWANNVMAFCVMPGTAEKRIGLIHHLEGIRIERDDPNGENDVSEDSGEEETEEA